MADPDLTIAANPHFPQPVNPLVSFGQTLQTASAMRDYGIKNALAAAYQNAPIDPATGAPDMNAVVSSLRGSGAGALAVPEAVQAAQEQQKRALEINQAQLVQQKARADVAGSFFAPVYAKGNQATPQDIFGAVARMHAAGFPTDEAVNQIATSMPTLDPAKANDPGAAAAYGKQLSAWAPEFVKNVWGASLPAASQAQVFAPDLMPVNQGDQTVLVNRSATAGQPGQTYGTPLPNGMTAAEKTQPVQVAADAKGRPLYAPRGQYAASHGYGQAGNQTPDMGNGSYPNVPPALRNPNATNQSGPAPIPSEGGLTPMDVGPGDHSYLQSRGTESASEMNSLNAAANDIPQQQSQLNAMLGDLQKFKSGANSTLFGRIKNSFVQLGLAPESWSDSLSAQENFTKMANQFLAKQAGAMGPVTNDKLALSGESGPNPLFSNLGNEGVLHIAQGNMDALSVKNQAALAAEKAAEKSGQTFNYPQWSAQFNQSFAPSAFWYSRMTPQERQTLVGGLKSPEEKADFQAKIVNAINNKWIDPATLGLPVRQNGQ